MHINIHLPQHAISFANLINSSVGVKEMVHRMFKNFAPHTNKKEIDYDLIKRYNTIEALRTLYDININNPIYKYCDELFNNWYMASTSNNISEGNNILFKLFTLIILIFSIYFF